jgi:hypothetical protein
MNTGPHTLIKSRETLQAICNDWQELRKYEAFDRILDYIWNEIKKPGKGKTKQIFHLAEILRIGRHSTINLEAFRLELIEILKKEYLGCDVSYVETKTTGYDGKILIVEQLIIIDWS